MGDEFDPDEFDQDSTEVVPVLDDKGTDPHAKSPEWLAGFEVGRAEGLKLGKEEGCKACFGEGQEDGAVVLRSMLYAKKTPDDEVEAVVAEYRRRLSKL